MKNPRPLRNAPSFPLTLAALAGAIALGAVAGCEKKAPPPPPVVTSTAPPAPTWSLEDIDMDARVQFPEGKVPSSLELAEAVAALASAIASGDEKGMSEVLDATDREVLRDLVGSGEWKSGTSGIEAVRVCVLSEGDDKKSATLGLGVQDKDGAFMLAWTGREAGTWRFQGMAIMPLLADRVAMLDDQALLEPSLEFGTAVAAKPEDKNNKPDEPEDTAPDPSYDEPVFNPPSDSPFNKPVG